MKGPGPFTCSQGLHEAAVACIERSVCQSLPSCVTPHMCRSEIAMYITSFSGLIVEAAFCATSTTGCVGVSILQVPEAVLQHAGVSVHLSDCPHYRISPRH